MHITFLSETWRKKQIFRESRLRWNGNINVELR